MRPQFKKMERAEEFLAFAELKERADKTFERADKMIERADKMIERADKMIERADKMIERSDKMIERSDKMFEELEKWERKHNERILRGSPFSCQARNDVGLRIWRSSNSL